jgi:hypothetical protein
MMRCIGVYVSQSDITVAMVKGNETVWVETASLSNNQRMVENTTIASELGILLDRIPRPHWPDPRVNVTMGPPWGRVKLVKGMPPVTRHSELVPMLRLNTNRFIAASRPVLVTGAVVTAPGEANVGVVDRGLTDAITHEIFEHNLRIVRIAPVILPERQERSKAQTGAGNNLSEPPSSEELAVAAARGKMPYALGRRDNPAASLPDISRKRLAFAGITLATATLIFTATQFRIERAELTRNAAAVRRIAAASDSGIGEEQALGQLDRDLATAAKFSRRRVSVALLLGAITQALPAEAAIATLRIDTANVDIVELSPRTAAVVDALSDVPNLVTPTIVGPVSRETIGSRELERATIRLRIAPDYGRGMTRFVVERDGDK